MQYLLRRHPELPDVPTSAEVASTPEQATILRTVSSASEIGKFILTTPGVPADRVAALRKAFEAVVKDPEFLADATKLRIEIDPLSGMELQKIVQRDPEHPAGHHREGQEDLSAELTATAAAQAGCECSGQRLRRLRGCGITGAA